MEDEKKAEQFQEEEIESVSRGDGLRVYTCSICLSRFGTYAEYAAHLEYHKKFENKQ